MTAQRTNIPGVHTTADERIRSALRSLERAQAELYGAMAEVAPVIGMAPAWKALGKEADRVKVLWHKLNAKFRSRETWELDEI